MNSRQRRAIHALADRIRDVLQLSPPVNTDQAVTRLGGRIVYDLDADSDCEAMVKKVGDAFEIHLSDKTSAGRQKFSVAHEIGHLFLHMGYLLDEQRWNSIVDYKDSVKYRLGYSEEETEANEFAAAFLMPKSRFEEVAAKNLKSGKYNITAIAKEFNVSVSAAITRGRWLGLFSWSED